jgi:hypothetical protein
MILKDLSGQRVGRWLIQNRNYSKKGVHWNCICDCGNEKILSSGVLINKQSQSCGCLWRENIVKSRTNILGQRFGRLLVIGEEEKHGYWKCKCDCGKETIKYISSLKAGSSKSCGCLRIELMTGENNRGWKGGVWDERRNPKHKREFGVWNYAVKKRDNRTCQRCQSIEKIHAHHIVNYASNKELGLDVNNGITLCESCHKLFHKTYGKKINSQEQLNEFLHG